MIETTKDYVPALRFDWLTRFYDPVIRLMTREKTFKNLLIQQARMGAQDRVLDVGCGTGTLAIWIKQRHPGVEVVGLDGDAEILERARRKASRYRVSLSLDEGLSYALPYEDASFDRVFSSLFFHHLSTTDKTRSFAEILRVLKPGGSLHVADWGVPTGRLMRSLFLFIQTLNGFANTRDNLKGMLPRLMQGVGFDEVDSRYHVNTMFGTLRVHRATKKFVREQRPKVPEKLSTLIDVVE